MNSAEIAKERLIKDIQPCDGGDMLEAKAPGIRRELLGQSMNHLQIIMSTVENAHEKSALITDTECETVVRRVRAIEQILRQLLNTERQRSWGEGCPKCGMRTLHDNNGCLECQKDGE